MLPLIRERFSGEGLGVFADLKSNPLAIIEMARTGVTVDVIRNGHSQIKQSLLDDPARLGAVEESAHFYEAFSLGDSPRFCTENTLYIALLAARMWRELPERVQAMFELQATTAREREWGYKFPSDQQRDDALQAVREHFESQGARSMTRMKNGMELEATLMRRGLPFDVGPATKLGNDWLQVCQRISQSEDRLALGSFGSGPNAGAGSKGRHRGVRREIRCGERVSRLEETTMYALDWLVIAAYFGAILGISWWVVLQGKDTANDYFLADRNLGWFVVGCSIFASNIGSEHIVGLAGSGCTDGVAMAHYELHAWCLLVLAWVMVPFYVRSMVFTMPEFLERRFSPTSRYVLSAISLVAYVLTKIAVGIFAGGVVFKTLMPEVRIDDRGVHADQFLDRLGTSHYRDGSIHDSGRFACRCLCRCDADYRARHRLTAGNHLRRPSGRWLGRTLPDLRLGDVQPLEAARAPRSRGNLGAGVGTRVRRHSDPTSVVLQ